MTQYGGACKCNGCAIALQTAWGGQRPAANNTRIEAPPGLQLALPATGALPSLQVDNELAKLKDEVEKIEPLQNEVKYLRLRIYELEERFKKLEVVASASASGCYT